MAQQELLQLALPVANMLLGNDSDIDPDYEKDCANLCTDDCLWLECQNPYTQTILATLITWGGTALGAAVVLFIPLRGEGALKFLDASLGFAAGMMLAASFFSMLTPALEASEEFWGDWRWVPVSIGFLLGCTFVSIGGHFIHKYIGEDVAALLGHADLEEALENAQQDTNKNDQIARPPTTRSRAATTAGMIVSNLSFKRIVVLCAAITIHNIPEGAVVGVGFASGNVVTGGTVTLAIALQNFPEGLAVAMPLRAAGQSKFWSFFWGQLSGFIEPCAGMISVAIVSAMNEILPYALAFSAGCMTYVVLEDIIPDANERNNGTLAARVAAVGFLVMMALEIGFESIVEG